MMHCVKKVGRTMACHDKGPQTCHAERQRRIHVGRTHQLVTPDASLPLSMTCPGAFFTACHEKVAGTCHSERQRRIRGGPRRPVGETRCFAALSMTRERVFFTACRKRLVWMAEWNQDAAALRPALPPLLSLTHPRVLF